MSNSKQAGVAKIIIVIGVFFVLGVVVVLLQMSGNKSNDTGTVPTSDTSASGDSSGSSSDGTQVGTLTGTPDVSSYYQLTNSTYGFLVDYPKAWSNAQKQPNASNTVSRYSSSFISALALDTNSQLDGYFFINTYEDGNFTSPLNQYDPIIKPQVTSDGSTVWTVTDTGNDTKHTTGSAVKVPAVKNDNGTVVYNLSWQDDSSIQGRWFFHTAGNKYDVLLSLPLCSMKQQGPLTKSVIQTYTNLSENIARTIKLTKVTGSSSSDTSISNAN